MRSRPIRPAPAAPAEEKAADDVHLHSFMAPRPVHPMAVLRAQIESVRTLVNALAGKVTPEQLQDVVGVQCDAAVALCDSLAAMRPSQAGPMPPRTVRRAFSTFEGAVMEHDAPVGESGATAPPQPPTIDVDQGGDITVRRET